MSDNAKKLSYKNRWVEFLEQSTPNGADCLPLDEQFIFPDETTEQYLIWRVNQTEFTQVFSAVMYGADLAYPDCAIDTMAIFLRLVCENVDICDLVADCIADSANVQSALQTYLESKGYGSAEGTPSTPSTYNEDNPLLDGSLISGCDNDNLFGGVTQLVDLMNTMLEDFFEHVEGLTEGAERWGALLEAIPITNVLAIDDLIQFADQLIENIGQSYSAEYTAVLRDEFRCDLFCLVKDTCELDFQAWADYFMDLLGESITENAFENTIAWFTGGNFSNEEIVYAGHAIICQIFAYGSKFFGFDMVWFGKVVTAAMNDPDSDWTILCDDCTDGWCYEFDWLTSQQGWTACNFNSAVTLYSTSVGFYGSGSQEDRVNAYRDFAGTVEYAELTYRPVVAATPSLVRIYINTGGCSTGTYYTTTNITNNMDGTYTAKWTAIPQLTITDGIMVYVEDADATPVYELQKLLLSSTVGSNPFASDNC